MKKVLLTVLCVFAVLVTVITATLSYAYFSKREIYQGLMGAEIELLFDRLSDKGRADYLATFEEGTAPTSTEWGSEGNPYVISNIKHLYNLAELQRLGYFDINYISQNYDANGNYIGDGGTADAPGEGIMPYFLVCTPDGNPVTIDGNSFGGDTQITAIGTEEYPFIGSVKGAFAEGSCEVGDGKTATVSAIYDVVVMGNPANVDAGLFGTIGYLGDSTVVDENGYFEGVPSVVSNLLLCDVTVSVRSSLWDNVTAFIEDHIFTFTALEGTENYNKIPHENHHIGILAGHIAYTKIEYISIYYTAESIIALDLRDTTAIEGTEANYLSISGVIGYMDNLNPVIGADGNSIGTGTGTSNHNISHSAVGGGGLASGDKAGYVIAAEIFNNYGYYDVGSGTLDSADGKILIRTATDANGIDLCQEWIRSGILGGTENTGRYYFYDGVFTFALSGYGEASASTASKDTIEPTWGPEQDGLFSIGSTDTSKWVTNYSKGNNAVAAFIKPVLNDDDLAEALESGKQIFILNENGDKINLMTLYKQSTAGEGGVENKYSVSQTTLTYANDLFIESILESYEGMTPEQVTEMFADMNADYKTPMTLSNAINTGELRVINVGLTGTEVTLDDLREQYKIYAKSATEGAGAAQKQLYQFFDLNNNPVSPTATGVQDYYDYTAEFDHTDGATNVYNGYFYYTVSKGGFLNLQNIYTFYWVDFASGTTTQVGDPVTEGFNSPLTNFFSEDSQSGTWQEEQIYTKNVTITLSGEIVTRTAIGVAVNNADQTFYGSGNTVTASGLQLSKPLGEEVQYFYQPVGETQWYYMDGTAVTISDTRPAPSTSVGGRELYQATVNGTTRVGVKLERYPMYQFYNGENYMSMINLEYRGILNIRLGEYHVLWNGTTTAAGTASNFKHTINGTERTPTVLATTQNATLKFNDDGTCYIRYTIGTESRYLNYSTSMLFNGASSNTENSTKLRIYTVEGTQNLDYGRVTFDPAEIVTAEDVAADTTGTKQQNTFNVDSYVLYANFDTDENGALVPVDSTTTPLQYTGNDQYSVVSLEDLGWNNNVGEFLSNSDLNKKFKLTQGITFGATINIFNGSLGTGGFLRAPVGSNGIEANIPQSCVAFRINKAGEKKIRVIVAVPTSEFYEGESNFQTDFLKYTNYFNLWTLEEAGESMLQMFNADEYLQRFKLPHSYPYEPGTSPTEGSYTTVNMGTVNEKGGVTPGTENYACSLNGDRVLVAYEFTVSEVGIYILGASGCDADGNYAENGVPMEIVYFSADGVASSGRDGQGGSQLGTIDFVYDYNGAVITVSDVYRTVDGTVTGENGESVNVTYEDYNTYYPTFVIPYFDNQLPGIQTNGFIAINDEVVRIWRYVGDTANENGVKSTVQCVIGSVEDNQSTNDKQYVKISGYTRIFDILNVTYQIEPDS